jgi:hypothetical protein
MRKFSVVEKIETHFIFNKFFSENHAVYDVIWKNMVEPNRAQVTVYYGACGFHWIT